MFMVVRPFLKKVGEVYANQEVINKTFVALILLILIISSTLTEIIGIHALFGEMCIRDRSKTIGFKLSGSTGTLPPLGLAMIISYPFSSAQ